MPFAESFSCRRFLWRSQGQSPVRHERSGVNGCPWIGEGEVCSRAGSIKACVHSGLGAQSTGWRS